MITVMPTHIMVHSICWTYRTVAIGTGAPCLPPPESDAAVSQAYPIFTHACVIKEVYTHRKHR